MFVSSFVWGGAILGGGLSLSILLCPRKTKKNLYNLTWEIMKGYVQLEDFCLKKVKPTLFKDINLDDDGIFKITFFNCETQKYESYIDNIPKINSDWFFIKQKVDNEYKCKIFENIELVDTQIKNYEKTDQLFIQIELKQNNETFDIKEAVEHFMLVRNKLFDRRFLTWLMKYWHNCKLSTNYTIHIIDNNINMIKLDQSQYIILYKNKYDIKDNKI